MACDDRMGKAWLWTGGRGGGLGRGDGTLGGLGVAGEKVVANMVR